MKNTLLIAAIVTALVGTTTTFGQGLLDQQLGPTAPAAQPKDAPKPAPAADKPVDKPADAPKPEAKPAKPAGTPGGDIISTDASKKVDDDELLQQLLQPVRQAHPSAVAKRLHDMVDRMQQTQSLLTEKKDPGQVTQETQRRIVADLDVMIELARQQQQQNSSSSSQQPQPGQPRQPGPPQGGKSGEGGNTAATSEKQPGGGYSDPVSGDIHSRDAKKTGATSPLRDRDQVAHGANEEYLTSYKDLIDRYYQALAEMGRSHGR